MAFDKFINKAKDTANNIKNIAAEQTNKLLDDNSFLSNLKGYGVNKINETVGELNDSTAIIKEAGYELSEIEVDVGLPFGITPHFILKNNISNEKRAQLLEEAKDKKVIHTILSILFNISELQNNLTFNQFMLYEVVITLGIPPKINVRFINGDNK
jgi:hypothetical protein